MTHILVIPGVGEIASGVAGKAAIRAVTLTESVGSTIAPGGVIPGRLQVDIYTDEKVELRRGQRVELYAKTDAGRRKEGSFYIDTLCYCGDHRCILTARDALGQLEQDVAGYLNGLTGWPYSLGTLASLVCSRCGVSLASSDFPGSGFAVAKPVFYYVTGSQVMEWIGQISGRFCRATADGKVEFAWYANAPVAVGKTPRPGKAKVTGIGGTVVIDAQNITLSQGKLTVPEGAASYTHPELKLTLPACMEIVGCALEGSMREYAPLPPVDSVRLGYSYATTDFAYPSLKGNTLNLIGNRLLKYATTQQVRSLAKDLYDQYQQLSYTPCRLRLPAEAGVRPGQILTVCWGNEIFTTLVIRATRKGSVTEIDSR